MATVNFTGKWMEESSTNKRAFLKKMGVPEEQLDMAAAAKMGAKMIHEGDDFTMIMLTPDGKEVAVNKFSIGVPFTPKMPAGEHPMGEMVCSYTEGGKVLHTESVGGIEFIDDTYLEANGDMRVVQKSGDVTNTTIYKKM